MRKFSTYKMAAMAVVALVTMLAVMPWAKGANFTEGTGSLSDPFIVSTKDDLDNIRHNPSAHYRLAGDIIFTAADFEMGGDFYDHGTKPTDSMSSHYGLGFEPIGMGAEPFTGSFDGGGNSIIGLQSSTDTSYLMPIGLFGRVEGAVIENLNVVDITLKTSSNVDIYTGGIAGHAIDSKISGCTVSGSITGDNQTGGIVGFAEGESVIERCTNYATVTAIDSEYEYSYPATEIIYAGGIVGLSEGLVTSAVNEGAVLASVEGNSMSYGYAGGIAGGIEGGRVTGSQNNATVYSGIRETADAAERSPTVIAGGIVGLTIGAIVDSSTNTEAVDSHSDYGANSGGIVGYDRWQSGSAATDISGCQNSGTITANAEGGTSVGGIVSSLSGNVSGCMSSGEVVGTTHSDRFAYGEVGGIAGVSTGYISTSYNTGNVTLTGSAPEGEELFFRIGGIVGRTFNGKGVENCYNTGDITATTTSGNTSYIYSGGICGMMENTSLINGYSYGTVTAPSRPSEAVGIIASQNSVFSGFYAFDGNRLVGTAPSGMYTSDYTNYTWRLDTEAERQSEGSYVGFDFDTTWTMQGGTPYPELLIFNTDAALTGIDIITPPTKSVYAVGDPLDLTGGEVRLIYGGSSTITPITADMISGYNASSVGAQSVTVTVESFSDSFTVEVKSSSEALAYELDQIIQLLPSGALTDEQKIEVKNAVAQAVKMLYNYGKENVRYSNELLEQITTLETALLNAEVMLSIAPTPPTIEEGVAAEHRLKDLPIELKGLVLSAHGGGGSGSPDIISSQKSFSIGVTQYVPLDGQDEIVLNIKPLEDGNVISNFNLATPVTFRLYLNDSFGGDIAYITHEIIESNENPRLERYDLAVYTDEIGKYIDVVATRFSTFSISETMPPPTAVISGKTISSHGHFNTTYTLYMSSDTEHTTPIATGSASSDGMLWGEQAFGVHAEYGIYDLVIEKDAHLRHIVTGINLTASGVNLGNITLYSGDVNEDGKINFLDLAIIRNSKNFGRDIVGTMQDPPAENMYTDLEGSGDVCSRDLAVAADKNNYNKNGDIVVPHGS